MPSAVMDGSNNAGSDADGATNNTEKRSLLRSSFYLTLIPGMVKRAPLGSFETISFLKAALDSSLMAGGV